MSQTTFKKERDPSILILDFGSQYSELIARRIRETNVFSLVVSNCISIEDINDINPKGIILSGGPNSVYEQNAPKCDEKIFEISQLDNLEDALLLLERFNQSLADKLFQNLSNMIEKRSFTYVNRYVKTDMEIASMVFDRKRKIRWSGIYGNKYISYFQ